MDETTPTTTLDGASYTVFDLTQVAPDTLQSTRFVEAELQKLRGEMSVHQTAHVTYARVLKAGLERPPAVETE